MRGRRRHFQPQCATRQIASNAQTAPSTDYMWHLFWEGHSLFHQQQDFAGAIVKFSESITLCRNVPLHRHDGARDGDYINFYYWRGYAYAKNSQHLEAVQDYTKALEYREAAQYYCRRGISLFSLDRVQEALLDFDKAITMGGLEAGIWVEDFDLMQSMKSSEENRLKSCSSYSSSLAMLLNVASSSKHGECTSSSSSSVTTDIASIAPIETSSSQLSRQSFMTSVLTPAAPSDHVLIRVWLPKDASGNFCTAHSAKNVGHVSLEVPSANLYVSFWPDNQFAKKSRRLAALFGTPQGCLIPNEEVDRALEADAKFEVERGIDGKISKIILIGEERQEPDVIVTLQTLKTTAIIAAFQAFYSSKASENHALLGTNIFGKIISFNQNHGQSCSGLVYALLNAGGIRELAAWDWISSWWVVAPDAVARIAVIAAEAEVRKKLASSTLPDGTQKIIKPDYSLNPHENFVGHYLAASGVR